MLSGTCCTRATPSLTSSSTDISVTTSIARSSASLFQLRDRNSPSKSNSWRSSSISVSCCMRWATVTASIVTSWLRAILARVSTR